MIFLPHEKNGLMRRQLENDGFVEVIKERKTYMVKGEGDSREVYKEISFQGGIPLNSRMYESKGNSF